MGAMAKETITAAAIDLGTNSFRLLIAEVGANRVVPRVRKLETVRLGQGLHESGRLAPEAVARGLRALGVFADILRRHEPNVCKVCGTHALRCAGNSAAFLQKAGRVLGVDIRVLSGAEEAALTLEGVRLGMAQAWRQHLLVMDVGGGSSECILAATDGQVSVDSIALGAVSLTESFQPAAGGQDEFPARFARMEAHIKERLAPVVEPHAALRPTVVACGGTATALAALDLGLKEYDSTLVQGHVLTASRLAALFDRLAALSGAERSLLAGLEHGRGDIILAGTKVYQVAVELLGVTQITVSDAGLLEGILLG